MILASNALWGAGAALLTLSLFLATARLLLGPRTLDRLVALDTLAAIGQCGLATYIAWTRDVDVAAAVIALALLGFVGTVSVARFRPAEEGSVPAPDPAAESRHVEHGAVEAPRESGEL